MYRGTWESRRKADKSISVSRNNVFHEELIIGSQESKIISMSEKRRFLLLANERILWACVLSLSKPHTPFLGWAVIPIDRSKPMLT